VDLATLRRAVGKIRARPRPAVPSNAAAPSVRVKSPLMWPWFRRPFDRRLNRRALLWALSREVAQLPQPRIAVTTIPLVADLAGALPVDRWVYYCVDDLSTWPGLESAPLLAMERDLLPKMQAVISVSHVLQDRLRSLGRESSLISHGVDLDHWKTNRQGAPTTDAVPSAPLPRVVFWGLVDERLDVDWLLAADSLTEGSIVVAGPIAAVDERLRRHPRIVFPGAIAYDALPALAAGAAVLVMPYRRMPATEAMQPLKLKEYLATGLPCIVRRLPATEPWADCADLVGTAKEFVTMIHQRLATGLPAAQDAARSRLELESWDAKAVEFERVLLSTGVDLPTESRTINGSRR
jgi:glycosyltransferase involved in cell wall biosynthesis